MSTDNSRRKSSRVERVATTIAAGFLLAIAGAGAHGAEAAEELRFAVGPLQPTPTETKAAYEPFFKQLAGKLGVDYTLEATNDWAGIAVALASGQVDVAWMGPWGYVIAHNQGAGDAIATAKYDGKPVYHAIVIARPALDIKHWPEDGKGLRMSFADVGSTSGWLIPTFWFKSHGLDPKTYFEYHEGATHAANEISVANDQSDLATDFDRNRTAMIEKGTIATDATKIVWRSDDLPNDPIVVRAGFDPALAKEIQTILAALTPDEAKAVLPTHYTGFIAASHSSYKLIEDAGIAVGKIKAAKVTN
ncbi:MAG TPA: phosphate/phosphite/phosphonate ABC transporter substrate-binding protein [Stellaceae bacterium]|nr:phosphate/phosphite/phosphonate ABC transporter substrate-binding protein [Stellaceae bacterium]